MHHARSDALDELEPLLAELRSTAGLTERSRCVGLLTHVRRALSG